MMLEHYALWNQTTTTSVCQRISPHVTYNICIHVYDCIEIQYHNVTCLTFLLSQCEADWMPFHFKESFFYHNLFSVATLFDHHNFGTPYILHKPVRKRIIVANQKLFPLFFGGKKKWLKLKPPHNLIVTWLHGVWACLLKRSLIMLSNSDPVTPPWCVIRFTRVQMDRPYEGSLWLAS